MSRAPRRVSRHLAARAAAAMSAPRATMRLQLHRDFTFADATGLVPYLAALGISHLYSSPILTARAGSMHGYDVIDPTRVNPELGGEAGLRGLVAALRAAGLGLIVDIVPNHMAAGGMENPWWADVLRHGRDEPLCDFLRHRLGRRPTEARCWRRSSANRTARRCATARSPWRATDGRAGDPLLRQRCSRSARRIMPRSPRRGRMPSIRRRRRAGARLHRLLERQHYRLAWWRSAGDEINWRRFFDINGLVGLRIEDEAVFEATHATLLRLYQRGADRRRAGRSCRWPGRSARLLSPPARAI